ncbi:MAG TPA: DUF924 family protein [Acetobacteraceae bacterium]|nr:DUF924 family protein [Acetobacteraceae bacterium]
MTIQPSEILAFWFEGDGAAFRDKWFEADDAFDTECCCFATAIRDARAGLFDHWAFTPHGALALIVLLDQLSRNVFRGAPEAFAADSHAIEIARATVSAGFDLQLTPIERMFVYLPFEHAETIEDQNESVRLYATLRDDLGEKTVDYADRHRDVILRFGRFPHRNAALGRSNTPEEEVYLAQPGAGF